MAFVAENFDAVSLIKKRTEQCKLILYLSEIS